MIQPLVNRFMRPETQDALKASFAATRPDDYTDLVRRVIEQITNDEYCEFALDPERIHRIDDGHYQGTLVYVIAEKGYQPSTYYYVKVGYGSCSGCDTLQRISGWEDQIAPEEVEGYMTLALHIVQGLKQMGDDE